MSSTPTKKVISINAQTMAVNVNAQTKVVKTTNFSTKTKVDGSKTKVDGSKTNVDGAMFCTFCKHDDHTIRDDDGNVTCKSLKENFCSYCKKHGHTNKRCPIAKENYLRSKVSKEKAPVIEVKTKVIKVKPEPKRPVQKSAPGSWAGRLASSITPMQQQAMMDAQEEIATLIKGDVSVVTDSSEYAYEQKIEARYCVIMEAMFGPFWPFKVYGDTKYDRATATIERTDGLLLSFEEFLRNKYSNTWLTDIVNTSDDCVFFKEKRIQTLKTLEQDFVTFVHDEHERIATMNQSMTKEEFEETLDREFDQMFSGKEEVEEAVNWSVAGEKKIKKGNGKTK